MAAHRYWRIFVAANNGGTYTEVAELQFREVAGTPQIPSGGTPIWSSLFSGSTTYQASNAFDGSNTTRWRAAGNIDEWIGYDYGSGNDIEPVEILLGAHSSNATYNSRLCRIDYSDNGVDWVSYGWLDEQTGWTTSQNRIITLSDASAAMRITQTPVMVIDLTNQPARITQVAIMAIALPFQPARITQAPVLVANHPTPTPRPLPVLPEIPVTETWQYTTVVNIAEASREQRSALRAEPRMRQEFNALILGDADRRDVYQMLFDYQRQAVFYPFYTYSTRLAAAVTMGATKVYFDPAQTDMRPGEALAFVDPQTGKTRYSTTEDTASLAERIITIDSVDADGVTFSEPLSFDAPAHWLVCPAPECRTAPSVGFGMKATAGDLGLWVETVELRPVRRPDQSVTLPTIDGIAILDKRPLADNDVDEDFDQNVTWLDSGVSRPQSETLWPIPFIEGKRQFLAHRPTDMDYWREFAYRTRGRWTPFIMPTFRDDLPLAQLPALGATVLTTTNIQFFTFWRSPAYRYIRIDRPIGAIYRRILEVLMNYDPVTGEPISADIKLTASIGSGAGANQISRVSYANLCRMASDNITLTHDAVDTVVSFNVRTIEA